MQLSWARRGITPYSRFSRAVCATQAPAARERRGAFRYGVRVRSAIAADPEAPSVECTIRDVSQTGALIEFEGVGVPEDFTRWSRAAGDMPRGGSGIGGANPLNTLAHAGVAQW